MILRKYHVVYSEAFEAWELRRLAADETPELVARYPTREAAVCGCKQYCGRQRCTGWVADLLAYDRDGRLAFEQLFDPGLAVC
ncbi:MAG TPA: hypothetical protein VLF18_02320 [Tahibacter sp.]|uniref:hypothetical protein n=1 Tax=Tahibacter sp. TaxID=2056211 RepID=UPI002C84BBE4|nr:hypothetical protein [Tahibacter sp.]HSX59012.1 hypothetical protein [Tahibacter sp.]